MDSAPKDGTRVLLVANALVQVGMNTNGYDRWYADVGWRVEPTAWMPLPSLPEAP